MGGSVGGTPATISAGGNALNATATTIGQIASGATRAGATGAAAAGGDPVAGAIARFAAACSQLAADTGTQLRGAALVAVNGAQDLAHAGGSGTPLPGRPR